MVSHSGNYLTVFARLIKRHFKNVLNPADKYPFLLTMLVTSKCSRAPYCKNCWRPAETLLKEDMSLDSVDKAAGAGIPIILVSGGEPTEHSQFPEIISRLEKSGSKIYILTNGYNPGILLKSIHEKKTVRVILSANSYDPQEKLDTTLAAMKMLLDANIKVYLNIPAVCGYVDYDFLDRIEALIKTALRVHITRYADTTCLCSSDDYIWLKEYARHIAAKYGLKRVLVTAPVPKYLLPVYRLLASLTGDKFSECSGYPFRATMNEEGRLSDCIRKRRSACV